MSAAGLLIVAAGINNASSRGAAAAAGYDPVTEAERAASAAVSLRVGEAVRLLDLGRDLQARGEFPEALASFTRVVAEYADLALSEYARVGRALVLYEIGDRDQSIAEMEDVSIALKGYPGQCVSCIYPPWMHASDLMVLHSINHSVVSIGD